MQWIFALTPLYRYCDFGFRSAYIGQLLQSATVLALYCQGLTSYAKHYPDRLSIVLEPLYKCSMWSNLFYVTKV